MSKGKQEARWAGPGANQSKTGMGRARGQWPQARRHASRSRFRGRSVADGRNGCTAPGLSVGMAHHGTQDKCLPAGRQRIPATRGRGRRHIHPRRAEVDRPGSTLVVQSAPGRKLDDNPCAVTYRADSWTIPIRWFAATQSKRLGARRQLPTLCDGSLASSIGVSL